MPLERKVVHTLHVSLAVRPAHAGISEQCEYGIDQCLGRTRRNWLCRRAGQHVPYTAHVCCDDADPAYHRFQQRHRQVLSK